MATSKRVVFGWPGDGRGDRLFAEGLDTLPTGYLHLARTEGRVRELVAKERSARGGSFGDRCRTLANLVEWLSRRRRTPRALLEESQQSLLIADLLAHDTTIPAAFAKVNGAGEWLAEFSRRLKESWRLERTGREGAEAEFSADTAKKRFPSLATDTSPFVEGGLVAFDRYMSRLKDLRVWDPAGRFIEVARDLGTDELPLDRFFPARRRLVVEGFYACSLIERQVFERLFDAWDEIVWLVDVPRNPMVRDRGADMFGAAVYGNPADVRVKGEYPDDCTWLADQGFDFAEAPSGDRPVWCPSSEGPRVVVEYLGTREGASWIAPRTTLDEARAVMATAVDAWNPGAAVHPRVVIAYPTDREVAPLLAALADEARVPLATAATTSLLSVGNVRTLTALLRLPERNFHRHAVLDAVRSLRYGLPLRRDGKKRRVYADAWTFGKVVESLRVVEGRENWKRELSAELDRADVACRHSDAKDSEDTHAARRYERVKRVHDAWLNLEGALNVGNTAEVALDLFLATVRRVLDLVGTPPSLTAGLDADDPDAFVAASLGWRGDKAIDTVLIEYAASAPFMGSAVRSWDDHVRTFLSMLGAVTVPVRPRIEGGIELIGLRDLRGLRADVVIVAGLLEGRCPAPPPSCSPWSEKDARSVGMPDRRAALREVEHLLAHAMNAAPRVVLSHAQLNDDGGVGLPARAYEELRERLDQSSAGFAGGARFEVRNGCSTEEMAGRLAKLPGSAQSQAGRLAPNMDGVAQRRRKELLEPSARFGWIRHASQGARAVLARRQGPPGRYDGMIGERAPWLSEYREGTRSLSVSALDNWVKCPLKWFFRNVLDVRPEMDVEEDLTAAEVGTLVHAILETYEASKDAARRSVGMEGWDARARMRAIATEHLEKLRLEELRKDRLMALLGVDDLVTGGDGGEPPTGLLEGYLERERSRRQPPTRTWCETAFGRVPRDGDVLERNPVKLETWSSASFGEKPVTLALSGSIDRIDFVEHQSEDGGLSELFVIDYKVTGSSMNGDLVKGLRFQLPLYLKVVEKLKDRLFESAGLSQDPNHVHARSGVYFRLDTAEQKVRISPDLTDPSIATRHFDGAAVNGNSYKRKENDVEKLTNAYMTRAADVVVAMEQGRFHPTAVDNKPCEWCEYKSACPAAGKESRFHAMDLRDGVFPQETPMLGAEAKPSQCGDEQ